MNISYVLRRHSVPRELILVFSLTFFGQTEIFAQSDSEMKCYADEFMLGEQPTLNSQNNQTGNYDIAVYYAVPKDIPYSESIYQTLVQATLDIQAWYQIATGGVTWKLAFPEVVQVYNCKENRQYYKDTGDWWGSLPAEMTAQGLPVWSSGTVTAIWAHGAGWWAGGAQSCGVDCGLALLGVEAFPQYNNSAYSGDDCPGGVGAAAWPCTPVGAYAHELGHAFGLIHPKDDPVTDQDASHSIMQTHWNYPNYAPGNEQPWGFLTTERTTLRTNPFFYKDITINQTHSQADVVNLPITGSAPSTDFDAEISGKDVIFQNHSTGATLYYWTFGDGVASNTKSPGHTYTNTGTYTATLRASKDASMMGIDSTKISIVTGGQVHPCAWGSEVENASIPLHMPFAAGTTWQTGGVGSYYGDGSHTNNNNDYYATDWNMVGDDDYGQPVYPVAAGKVVGLQKNCDGCTTGYGNYVDIVHSSVNTPLYGTIKTRYAHLSKVSVLAGDNIYVDTKIGEVGSTGGSTGPHLHLSFQVYNGSRYVSMRDISPSRRPSPMIAQSGVQTKLWDLCDGQSQTVAKKQFFNDVKNEFWAKKWIDAAYTWGVMEPCSPYVYQKFCPHVPVTRGNLAKYWVKAYHGPDFTPPAATGIFDDVPRNHATAAWIEQLYRDGFTAGCSTNPLLYCPNRNVKRAEMAVFILRALHGSGFFPPEPTGTLFGDCDKNYWGTKWVEQLAKEGITSGCSLKPSLFCPENPVTRGEMAVFLLRSFGVYPPITGGSGGAEKSNTWQVNLNVTDANTGSAHLIFGQAPTATNGIDSTFTELELAPPPANNIFDARFDLPISPPVSSLKDYRTTTDEDVNWHLKFQASTADFPIKFDWNTAELPDGEFFLKDTIAGTVNINMKNQNSFTVTNSALNSLTIQMQGKVTGTEHPSTTFLGNFHLKQNYPNPFNPTTAIKYELPTATPVRLQVFNISGQIVRTLVDKKQTAGFYYIQWDGCDDRGLPMASGIYLLQMKTSVFVQTRKMLLVR